MSRFAIYAGVDSAWYQGEDEFNSPEEALSAARAIAIELYEELAGSNSYLSWDNCLDELTETYPDEIIGSTDVYNYYNRVMSEHIKYTIKQLS